MTDGSEPIAPVGTTTLADRVGRMYGLRIVASWGFERTLRTVGVVVWAGLLANVIMIARPDLLNTADFGSDTSNYVAFGERLADRGQLYDLSPGDRPVAADNPPSWTVPILSPPQMAVPWAAMTPMPDAVRFYLPWAIGVAGTIAVGILFMRRAPVLLVLVTLPFLKGLALTAWSGNVNALIAPAAVLTWWAGREHSHRFGVIATGAMAATLGAAKIGPTLLWAWLIGRRPWDAIAGGLLAVGVLTGIVVLLVGLQPFQDYLLIALGNASAPSALSFTGVLTGLGMPMVVARVVWLGAAVALGVTAFVSRRSPRIAFAAAAAGLVLLTPIVRSESISLALVVAGAPWTAQGRPMRVRVNFAIAGCVAAAAVSVSVMTGGLTRSAMYLENATDQAVIVRFSAPGQSASWGYLVNPGQSGTGWSDQTGGVLGPVRVFDAGCRLLNVTDVAPLGGSYKIDAEGLHDRSLIAGATYLPYDARCSEQMPKFDVETK